MPDREPHGQPEQSRGDGPARAEHLNGGLVSGGEPMTSASKNTPYGIDHQCTPEKTGSTNWFLWRKIQALTHDLRIKSQSEQSFGVRNGAAYQLHPGHSRNRHQRPQQTLPSRLSE